MAGVIPLLGFVAKETAIAGFCETNYGVDFPMTAKQHVIGGEAHPLYRWIAAEVGEDAAPRWNFHKYLIDGDGQLAGMWPSRVEPTADEVLAMVRRRRPSPRYTPLRLTSASR